MYTLRVAIRQRVPGEARNAIAAVFGLVQVFIGRPEYQEAWMRWWYRGRARILSGFVGEICERVRDRRPQILDVGCGTGKQLAANRRHLSLERSRPRRARSWLP